MKPSSHVAAAQRAPQTQNVPPPERRSFLEKALAAVIGLVVGVFPLASGLLVFLDPVLRKKSTAGDKPEAKPILRVASLGTLQDGKPAQVPVIADLVDAWNREINQPVGAVYLIKKGDKVTAFNAICPHAGCFVGYSAERNCFQCPCHTSSFQLDGERIQPSPSPRSMDPLEVEVRDGDVWVQFVNYYPGKEEREEKQ
jgi:Rieske Fe-S protein